MISLRKFRSKKIGVLYEKRVIVREKHLLDSFSKCSDERRTPTL